MNQTSWTLIAGGVVSVAVGVAAWLGIFHEVMGTQTALVVGALLIPAGLGAFGIKVALDIPPKP